jgi:predicted PurR-regulated permease PerM
MKLTRKLLNGLLFSLLFPAIVLNFWVFLVVLNYLQPLINILALATIFSFLLDYPVHFLQRYKIKRNSAVLIVLLMSLLLLFILGITLIPIIIEQSNTLAQRLPEWIESGSLQIKSFQTWAENHQFPLNPSLILSQFLEQLSTQVKTFSGDILSGLLIAVGGFFDFLLTTVITFYLLLHGDQLWQDLFKIFPEPLRGAIRQSLKQNFHNYFIGQATVAAFKGLTLTLIFFILQIPLFLLFGVGVGVMALVPFGGALGIGIIAFLMALKSIWLGIKILVIAILTEQIIEQVIAPRLLGGLTGLNPVLILVSLLLGAKIAGFLGLLLAVPLSSFIKNLITILKGYK